MKSLVSALKISDPMKAVLALSIAIVVAACIVTYFSPYHSCVRAIEGQAEAIRCARALGGSVTVNP